jgi:hypothetical protein
MGTAFKFGATARAAQPRQIVAGNQVHQARDRPLAAPRFEGSSAAQFDPSGRNPRYGAEADRNPHAFAGGRSKQLRTPSPLPAGDGSGDY